MVSSCRGRGRRRSRCRVLDSSGVKMGLVYLQSYYSDSTDQRTPARRSNLPVERGGGCGFCGVFACVRASMASTGAAKKAAHLSRGAELASVLHAASCSVDGPKKVTPRTLGPRRNACVVPAHRPRPPAQRPGPQRPPSDACHSPAAAPSSTPPPQPRKRWPTRRPTKL